MACQGKNQKSDEIGANEDVGGVCNGLLETVAGISGTPATDKLLKTNRRVVRDHFHCWFTQSALRSPFGLESLLF
jgi:hypothetical protein